MAMSRILSQSLFPRASLRPPTAIIGHNRRRSTKSNRAQLVEVELDAASSPSEEVIAVGVKKLEEAIHGMMARRAAPDWLPFLPGYSYWVPPPRSSAKSDSSRKPLSLDLLSEDERMSYTSPQGWPSSDFFVEYSAPIRHIPVLELEVNLQDNEDTADQTSNSEDEGK